jgi:hypothetical protein
VVAILQILYDDVHAISCGVHDVDRCAVHQDRRHQGRHQDRRRQGRHQDERHQGHLYHRGHQGEDQNQDVGHQGRLGHQCEDHLDHLGHQCAGRQGEDHQDHLYEAHQGQGESLDLDGNLHLSDLLVRYLEPCVVQEEVE